MVREELKDKMRMKKPKLLFRILPLVFFLLLVNGCGIKKNYKIIRLGHSLNSSHPVHKAMVFMARKVKEYSHGELRIKIYPDQQLGTERECVELLQIGSLGMTKISASVMERFAPEYAVFSLPYVFRDKKHYFETLDGPIGKKILNSTEDKLIKGLCYYDAGSRSFYTKEKPILTPADLKGMKIRTMQSPTAVKMVNVLGGSATPIAWGELYTALQQGVVDGAENNPPVFYLSKHYEVCKYYSLDEHTSIPDVLIISTKVWNGLTKQEQEWLQKAVNESVIYQRKLWKEATENALKKVEEAGVKIFHPDKKPFVKKVQPLYEEYKIKEPKVYELLQQIKSLK